MTYRTFCIVDQDSRRRAAIAHSLLSAGMHAEPFETPAELLIDVPANLDAVLIHDDGCVFAELLQGLAKVSPLVPMLAYGEKPRARRVVDAVHQGADDYLAWPFSPAEACESAYHARLNGNSRRPALLRETAARMRLERLTNRERQVLTALIDGLTNRAIAEKLKISPRTVEIHRANMLNKMQAGHTSEAIRVGIEARLRD